MTSRGSSVGRMQDLLSRDDERQRIRTVPLRILADPALDRRLVGTSTATKERIRVHPADLQGFLAGQLLI